MSLPNLDKLVANKGVYIVNDTDEATKVIDGVFVLEDTVIATLKVGGVDALSSYVSTPATAVKAGAYIRPLDGVQFSGITLTSGSVALIIG
jgi:hypothetical protein